MWAFLIKICPLLSEPQGQFQSNLTQSILGCWDSSLLKVYAKVFWATLNIRSGLPNEHTRLNQILSDQTAWCKKGKTLKNAELWKSFSFLRLLSRRLKWAFLITICQLYVVVKFLHFLNLLQNHWANCNQTWYKASLGKGDSNFFKWRTMPFTKWRYLGNYKNKLTTF